MMNKRPLKECVCDWTDWFYDRRYQCFRCKKCFGKAKKIEEQREKQVIGQELSCRNCGTTENVEYGICSFCEEDEEEDDEEIEQ